MSEDFTWALGALKGGGRVQREAWTEEPFGPDHVYLLDPETLIMMHKGSTYKHRAVFTSRDILATDWMPYGGTDD